MRIAEFLLPVRSAPHKAALGLAFFFAVLSVGCSRNQADNPEQHIAKANEALEKDQLIEAEKEYREVLRLLPKDPVALRQLATIYSDQGQLRQAYPLLKAVAESEPAN